MLTRLHIKGFKNLADIEVRFGPFTCIAGPNASGKSNLFDAILFLKDLASLPIVEAASRVRERGRARGGNLSSLFTKTARSTFSEMSFEADFVVPPTVKDDFGREAVPSATFLTYRLGLRCTVIEGKSEHIELTQEELTYITRSEAQKRIGFRCDKDFLSSIIRGERRAEYITTEEKNGQTIIKLRQDGVQGRASEIPAKFSPRTVLGSINTDERPTVLAARREMQSWSLLQLEPTQMRAPDEFSDDPHVTPEGAHLASTLERLGKFDEVAERLSRLIPEVRDLKVDSDEARRLKTLLLIQRDGVPHAARSLSDGTLRFLSLAILAEDPEAGRLLCLEEPENGIHPSRIPAILDLLESIAVNPLLKVSDDNPLRQVIINTHSPLVVKSLVPENILVAVPLRIQGSQLTTFGSIKGMWREHLQSNSSVAPVVTLGSLMDYLNTDRGERYSEEGDRKSLWTLAYQQGLFDFMREDRN